MKSDFDKFTDLNDLKNKFIGNKKVLIADRSLPGQNLIHSLASFSLNKNKKFDAEVITDTGKNNEMLKVYKAFNINKIHYSAPKYNFFKIFIFINTLIFFILTYFKILLLGKTWFIKKFSYKKIYFGDLFYDYFAKVNLNYIRNNLLGFEFSKVLILGIYKINIVENILNKNKYTAVLSSTTVSISVSAITTRLALGRNIKVIRIIDGDFHIFNSLNEANRSKENITIKKIKNIIHKDHKWEKKLNLYVKTKFKGKLSDRDIAAAYKNTKNFSKISLLKKLNITKRYKRIGFFAPHSFNDTSYVQGKLLHLSLYDHFIKTVEIIKNSKNTLWLIKPHPIAKYYAGKNIVKDYVKSANCKNLIICPKYINNETMISISDIIVTCRGTIGLEAGFFGKKVVLAGESFYSDLNFSYFPKNNLQYENYLLNEKLNFQLTKAEQKICKKAYYYHIAKNSVVDSKILPLDKYVDFSLNEKRVEFKKYSFDRVNEKTYHRYFKIINKKIKKKSFLEDEFFIKLNKWLKEIRFK